MENDHDQFQDCHSRRWPWASLVIAATPALAAQRIHHPGYDARAQSHSRSTIGDGGMNSNRAAALRQCNDLAGEFSQSAWGNVSSDEYRACMAEHGESE